MNIRYKSVPFKLAGLDFQLDHTFEDPKMPERVRRFVATDDTIDRIGEVILPKGADFTNFRNNAPLLAFHDKAAVPIGKIVGAGMRGNQWLWDAEFDPADIDPVADQILKKVDHGTIKAVSVSVLPRRQIYEGMKGMTEDEVAIVKSYPGAYNIISQWEPIELSIVAIGMNPNALEAAMKSYYETLSDEEFGQKSGQSAEELDELALMLAEKQIASILETLNASGN